MKDNGADGGIWESIPEKEGAHYRAEGSNFQEFLRDPKSDTEIHIHRLWNSMRKLKHDDNVTALYIYLFDRVGTETPAFYPDGEGDPITYHSEA